MGRDIHVALGCCLYIGVVPAGHEGYFPAALGQLLCPDCPFCLCAEWYLRSNQFIIAPEDPVTVVVNSLSFY